MNDSALMCSAYKLLYEIETSLKAQLETCMTHKHGTYWRNHIKEKHRYDDIRLVELIPYFTKYTPINQLFTKTVIDELYKLIPIRNNICHMLLISDHEFIKLQNIYAMVMSKLKSLHYFY